MFDRVKYPARGRNGGLDGAPTVIAKSDGTIMKAKGKQFVAHGKTVKLEFPGGAGYGQVSERDQALVVRDLARGYISAESARDNYGLSDQQINKVLEEAKKGQTE